MHSYFCSGVDERNIKGTFFYGGLRPAIIEKDNIFGVPFHPENSQDAGFQLLQNFVGLR